MHFFKKISPYFTPLILFLIVLIPHFKVYNIGPKISLIDLLFPFLILILLFKYKKIFSLIKQNKNLKIYLFFLMLFFFAQTLSISFNKRFNNLRDLFELYKLLKFATIIITIYFTYDASFFKKYFKYIFVSVTFFNLLHYFNIFNFNSIASTTTKYI